MKHVRSIFVGGFFLMVMMHSALALPRFALVTGAKCGSCHVNPTGGQMRSDYGTQFSLEKIPLEATKDPDFTFDPKVSDNITIGGDYRGQFIYDFASKFTTFQAMTTSVYALVQAGKRITFSLKQDIINGSYNGLYGGIYAGTEVYGLFKILPGNWYVKGGSFMPDYGWKIDDHTSYTRAGDLGFTGAGAHAGLFFLPNYYDLGFEVGGSLSSISVTAGVFNGSGQKTPVDFKADKAYVAKVEYSGSFSAVNLRFGVSGYGYRSYKAAGIHLGLAFSENLVVLGEMDWTHHFLNVYTGAYSAPQVRENVHTMAAFAEVNYRAMQGLWLIGKYDRFDPLRGVSDDDVSAATNSVGRVTVGVEFFPYSFVEVRPQYRYTIERPSISNDVFLIQTHLWF